MVTVRADKGTKRRARRLVTVAPMVRMRVEAEGASPLQRAFFERVMTGLTRFAKGGDDALEAAMRASTDVGTLAYVASELAASLAVAELDPTAALLAEGAKVKQELLERAGGAIGVNDVARILGISRQAVDKRRRAHRLIAVPKGQDYAYPAAQFFEGGLVPSLDRALEAMPIKDPWMRLEWLLTDDDDLDGVSPLEALKAGRADDVIANATGHGA